MQVMQCMWSGRMPDNKDLVSTLQKNGKITSQKVADAMEQIDRAIFVPAGDLPYMDYPVPIGYNATISAPHMHAICLELLKDHLQPGMHALDVGAGVGHSLSCKFNHASGNNLSLMIYHISLHYCLWFDGAGTGYLTAIFALMVGDTGRSVGVEHIPELTAKAVANVQKSTAARLLNIGSLSLLTGGEFKIHDLESVPEYSQLISFGSYNPPSALQFCFICFSPKRPKHDHEWWCLYRRQRRIPRARTLRRHSRGSSCSINPTCTHGSAKTWRTAGHTRGWIVPRTFCHRQRFEGGAYEEEAPFSSLRPLDRSSVAAQQAVVAKQADCKANWMAQSIQTNSWGVLMKLFCEYDATHSELWHCRIIVHFLAKFVPQD